MSEKKKNVSGHKSNTQLLGEMLAGVAKQQEINKRLRAILESLIKVSAAGKVPELTGEKANIIKELFIEAEALQAEERAAFHQLFGFADDDIEWQN